MWFYAHNKKAEGPVSEEILLGMLRSGVLANEVLVWQEGRTEWAPARSVFADLAEGESSAMVRGTPPPSPDTGEDTASATAREGTIVISSPVYLSGQAPRPPEPRGEKKYIGTWLVFLLISLGLVLLMLYMIKPTPAEVTMMPDVLRFPMNIVHSPPAPEGLYYQVKKGGAIYVLGKRETAVRFQHGNTAFSKGRIFSSGRTSYFFEGDPRDPNFLKKLVEAYNHRAGTTFKL